jgi:hypothetical protein
MNHSARTYLISIGMSSALAAAAVAQQPPDVVKSDDLANTAMGSNALLHVNLDESGCHNTASGEDTLYSDTAGSYNTATGFSALFSNTTGNNNTSSGYESLYFNTTGGDNAGIGYQALYRNTTGAYNAAFGASALFDNSTGSDNAAFGYAALHANTGSSNTAAGYESLYANTSGAENTALGLHALTGNTTGSGNIGLGYRGGSNLTTGNNNVDIANAGVTAESGVIRIGTAGTQTKTYISGIYGTSVGGSAVMVNSSGQLGVVVSSERFKTDITPMGTESAKLEELRPVTFHLKTNPSGALQYGLIAEEVAKVYPELIVRDDRGQIDGVRYDELAPLLLNEMQQQQRLIAAQEQRAAAQDAKIAELERQLSSIETALAKLPGTDKLVARR